jgi:hypothetical protein
MRTETVDERLLKPWGLFNANPAGFRWRLKAAFATEAEARKALERATEPGEWTVARRDPHPGVEARPLKSFPVPPEPPNKYAERAREKAKNVRRPAWSRDT